MDNSLTAKDLMRNAVPDGIPHLLTYSDGLVGALLPRTREYITSPNCTSIPHPPHGSTRDLHWRADGLFGDDDPISWPQPLNPSYIYLTCIPKIPTCDEHPYNDYICMWRKVSDEYDMEFTPQGRQRREGVVSSTFNLEFHRAIEYLRGRTWPYIHNTGGAQTQVHRLLSEFESNMGVCLQRVTSVSMSMRDLRCGVVELQRNWLTSIAVLDFVETFQKLMDTPAIDAENRMGVYVWNDKDELKLFNARLLVYFLRPFISFDRQVVRCVKETDPPRLCLEVAALPYPLSLVSSQAGSDEKFAAIRAASISCFNSLSPFQNMHLPGAYSSSYNTPGSSKAITTPSELPSSMNINSSTGPVRPSAGRVTPRSAPYSKQPSNRPRGKKPSQNPAQAQRNLFDDLPTDSIIPPLLECWKGANRTIDVAHVSAWYQSGNLPKLTTVAPEPATYLKQWTSLRAAWARRCGNSANESQPVAASVWKNVLGLSLVGAWCEGQQPTNRQQRDHQEASLLVSATMARYDPDIPVTLSANAPQLDEDKSREIVHELSIVNFRFQLTSLDCVADSSAPRPSPKLSSVELGVQQVEHRTRRTQLIDSVFGGSTNPFVSSDALFDRGIAAASWAGKVPAL
ncbi:hypothetical protein PQX77_010638 [Marasmius sp. AFHP31]|nr:hypothetical protein PQX77_010638 [Marasmius sp. AFHP31]